MGLLYTAMAHDCIKLLRFACLFARLQLVYTYAKLVSRTRGVYLGMHTLRRQREPFCNTPKKFEPCLKSPLKIP